MRHRLSPSASLAFALFAACEEQEPCKHWTEVECSCEDGRDGTKLCLSNGTFDDCYCGSSDGWDAASPRDAGLMEDDWELGGGGDGPEDVPLVDAALRDAGVDAAAASDGELLASGTEKLLDVFARGEDVWLMLEHRVARISLADGAEIARWEAPRALLEAAFDGQRLAVLDGARLTMLEASELTPQLEVNLIEPCTSAVLMSAGPLVCSNSAAGDTLYVIDPVHGAMQSAGGLVRSGQLSEVPGTRRVLTTGVTNVADSRLFEIDPDGGVPSVVDAGLAVDAGVRPTTADLATPVAFDAIPPQNLVTRRGVLLRMSGTCTALTEPCLSRTGTLGLFGTNDAFIGMHTVDDELFGLLESPSTTSSTAVRCRHQQPCKLMRIDVAARETVAEQTVRRPLRRVIALRPLPAQEVVVLAIGVASGTSTTQESGFEVVRLHLSTAE